MLAALFVILGCASALSPLASDADKEAAAIKLLKPFASSDLASPVMVMEESSSSASDSSTKTLVQTAIPGDPVCLDGSPFYIYFRPASDPENADKFAMYLEGGGLCVEREDCHQRAKSALGSSTYWDSGNLSKENNILSTDASNPFHSWNHVFMRYCSGDTWTGTQTLETGPGRYDLYFNGHEQVKHALSYLEDNHDLGVSSSSQFILSGESAGGIGTNTNCDYVAERYPGMDVRCSPQAGLFFPAGTVAEWAKRLDITFADMNSIASW